VLISLEHDDAPRRRRNAARQARDGRDVKAASGRRNGYDLTPESELTRQRDVAFALAVIVVARSKKRPHLLAI
jgi:hypothetical protein